MVRRGRDPHAIQVLVKQQVVGEALWIGVPPAGSEATFISRFRSQ